MLEKVKSFGFHFVSRARLYGYGSIKGNDTFTDMLILKETKDFFEKQLNIWYLKCSNAVEKIYGFDLSPYFNDFTLSEWYE